MSKKLALPTERQVWEIEQGTVIFKIKPSQALGGVLCPQFDVQLIDQYRFQREWTIGKTHKFIPGAQTTAIWHSHMYRHPGRRAQAELTEAVAMNVMTRFHHLLVNYPTLLFNEGEMVGELKPSPGWYRPRHEGFVQFSERVLDGARMSCELLI